MEIATIDTPSLGDRGYLATDGTVTGGLALRRRRPRILTNGRGTGKEHEWPSAA